MLANDAPIETDLLGYSPYSDAIAEVIASTDLYTPFIIGIFGPWGTGKSTFMYMMDKHLSNSTANIWFQPWQFENKEEIWKALIYTVLQHLEALNNSQSGAEKDAEKIRELISGVGRIALNHAVKSLSGNAVDLDKMVSFLGKNEVQNAKFINTFRKEFGELKTNILKRTKRKRLVIFIDDLDRCTPENALIVLESIKLFFDFEGCVFVLGIDKDVIQKGVELKYAQSIGIKGEDYLEKMIQLPFSLPPIKAATFQNFVGSVARNFKFEPRSIELITLASQGNPRRVKRLCNLLFIVKKVAGKLNTSQLTEEDILTYLLIVQVKFPFIHRIMAAKPDLYPFFGGKVDKDQEMKLKAYCESSNKTFGVELFQEFVDFSRAAQRLLSSKINDPKELTNYLKLTGIVDVEKSDHRPKYLSSVLDSRLATAEDTVTEVQPEAVPLDMPSLRDETSQLRRDWEILLKRRTLNFIFSASNDLHLAFLHLLEKAETRRRLIVELGEKNWQTEEVLSELSSINPDVGLKFVYRTCVNIFSILVLVGLLTIYANKVYVLFIEGILGKAFPATSAEFSWYFQLLLISLSAFILLKLLATIMIARRLRVACLGKGLQATARFMDVLVPFIRTLLLLPNKGVDTPGGGEANMK